MNYHVRTLLNSVPSKSPYMEMDGVAWCSMVCDAVLSVDLLHVIQSVVVWILTLLVHTFLVSVRLVKKIVASMKCIQTSYDLRR